MVLVQAQSRVSEPVVAGLRELLVEAERGSECVADPQAMRRFQVESAPV